MVDWRVLAQIIIHNGMEAPHLMRREGKDHGMQFILGAIFFVVVVGILGAGVPWPRCRATERKQ